MIEDIFLLEIREIGNLTKRKKRRQLTIRFGSTKETGNLSGEKLVVSNIDKQLE